MENKKNELKGNKDMKYMIMEKTIKTFKFKLYNGEFNKVLNENQIKAIKYELENFNFDDKYCYGLITGIYIMFM